MVIRVRPSIPIPAEIFRAYDLRGIVGETLSPDIVELLGRAIGSQAKDQAQHEVIVARDGRLSGIGLQQALIRGLRASGCNVLNVGAVPTPLLYFATNIFASRSGVMLTGSHNPANYNGCKIVIDRHTLAGDEITALKTRIEMENFTSGQGALREAEVIRLYQQQLCSSIRLARPLKVIVDAGNGIVGNVAPAFYRALGCEVEELFCEVDGNFPNHHPDPSELENLRDLQAAVVAKKADIGLAFDGDGDRLGVVTAEGEVIFPDRQMILFAKSVLETCPGGKVIYDVKCTAHLAKAIEESGGVAIMSKTGHSFVKNALQQQKAVLAGEMSGHIFFADHWYGFDDGIYAGARMLEILSKQTDMKSFWEALPNSINTPEIKVEVNEQDKFRIVEDFIEKAHFTGGKKITIDGLRVEFPDGWGLLRASNTTPCLILRFEANSQAALEIIKQSFVDQLAKVMA